MSFVGTWFGFSENSEYDAAMRAYTAGDHALAAELFRTVSAMERDPAVRSRAKSYLAGSLGQVGRAAMEAGDWDAAERALGDAVGARPRYADLHALLAAVHFAKGEHGHASQEVDAALRINAKYGLAMLFRAALDLLGNDPALGIIGMVEAVAADRRLETDLFREALAAADAEDYETAARTAFQVRPGSAMVDDHLRSGDSAMREKRWADAAAEYRRASAIAPSYADVRARLGQALLELGELDGAVEAFQQSVALAPQFAAGHSMLGVALRRKGDEVAAKSAFHAAVAIDPAEPIARYELGRLP